MPATRAKTFLAAALLLVPCRASGADECPGVVFVGEKISLSAVERRLVCGDPGRNRMKTLDSGYTRLTTKEVKLRR